MREMADKPDKSAKNESARVPGSTTTHQPTTTRNKRKYVDEQMFRLLVRFATVADVLIIVLSLAAYMIFPSLREHSRYVLILPLIGAFGITYNYLVWRRWHEAWPQLAIQLSILTPLASLLILAAFTGGVNSPWFSLWLIGLICGAMAGSLTTMLTAATTLLFFAISVLWLHQQSDIWSFNIFQMVQMLAAFAVSIVIGREVDRMVRTMQFADSLTHQLDSSELKDQLMMGAIADAVVAVNRELKVVLFNDAAEQLTGWDGVSAKDVEYGTIFRLRDQQDTDLTPETDPFQAVLKTGKQKTVNNLYMLNRDKEKISFSISIAPTLDAHGDIGGAIAVFHDISDQTALARERNEFISTASHEMRTPVAAIEGYLSMALNPRLATVDERANGFLNKAHDSSIHLGKLFRDLLSVTKIEDNRMSINRRPFNLSELLAQVVAEMDIIAKQKNLQLTAHFGANDQRGKVVAPLYRVNADPDRVREIITNLIDNAIKYSPQGTVEVSLRADNDLVTLSVQDRGIGISPEDQKHLFQKFYRVNSSFTREIGGTGLGLYIARNLVEQFGGRIWVEAAEGKGSTFSFSLPLVRNV